MNDSTTYSTIFDAESKGGANEVLATDRTADEVFRPRSRMEVALWYAEQFGWLALPAYKKQAMVPWRDEVMPTLPSVAELKAIWNDAGDPNANIALLTGRRSGFMVGDVDPRNGGQLETLWELGWPQETPIVRSAGEQPGWHVYVACPPEGVASIPQYAPGIELKADGTLVIAPPSRHPDTGQMYAWEPRHEPWNVPLASLPCRSLMELALKQVRRSTRSDSAQDPDDLSKLVYPQRETLRLVTTLLNRAFRKVSDGEHRNNVAYWLGQQLGSLGLTRAED